MVKNSKRKVINTRDKIIQLFPDRELVLINCPLEEDRHCELGNLDKIELKDLNEKFLQDAEHLQEKLINDTAPK